MGITEKVAYLKGLLAGLDLKEDSKESKLFHAILDTLDEMAMAITDLEENQGEIEELVSIIDEDLGNLEEDYYDLDDDDDDLVYAGGKVAYPNDELTMEPDDSEPTPALLDEEANEAGFEIQDEDDVFGLLSDIAEADAEEED